MVPARAGTGRPHRSRRGPFAVVPASACGRDVQPGGPTGDRVTPRGGRGGVDRGRARTGLVGSVGHPVRRRGDVHVSRRAAARSHRRADPQRGDRAGLKGAPAHRVHRRTPHPRPHRRSLPDRRARGVAAPHGHASALAGLASGTFDPLLARATTERSLDDRLECREPLGLRRQDAAGRVGENLGDQRFTRAEVIPGQRQSQATAPERASSSAPATGSAASIPGSVAVPGCAAVLDGDPDQDRLTDVLRRKYGVEFLAVMALERLGRPRGTQSRPPHHPARDRPVPSHTHGAWTRLRPALTRAAVSVSRGGARAPPSRRST
jgi:hypothetical protein